VRFATKWAMPGFWGLPPALGTAWFRPNYWHEFSGDVRTLFSSEIGFVPFLANVAEDWVELNTGLTVQVGRNTALFANGSYNIATDGNGEAWDGRIGLKVAGDGASGASLGVGWRRSCAAGASITASQPPLRPEPAAIGAPPQRATAPFIELVGDFCNKICQLLALSQRYAHRSNIRRLA